MSLGSQMLPHGFNCCTHNAVSSKLCCFMLLHIFCRIPLQNCKPQRHGQCWKSHKSHIHRNCGWGQVPNQRPAGLYLDCNNHNLPCASQRASSCHQDCPRLGCSQFADPSVPVCYIEQVMQEGRTSRCQADNVGNFSPRHSTHHSPISIRLHLPHSHVASSEVGKRFI